MGPRNERGRGGAETNCEARRAEQFPHLRNYTLTPDKDNKSSTALVVVFSWKNIKHYSFFLNFKLAMKLNDRYFTFAYLQEKKSSSH